MDKIARRAYLVDLVKNRIAWELPGDSLEICYYRLEYKSEKVNLTLSRFDNESCGCFKGIRIVVEFKDDPRNVTKLTIVEARPFSGYRSLSNWMSQTIKRLSDQLLERKQQEGFDRFLATL